jgi:hypothetical protein
MNGASAGAKRSPGVRVVRALLATVASLYVLAAAAIWFAQTKLLYHPRKTLDATPADLGLQFEPVRLALHGDLASRHPDAGALITEGAFPSVIEVADGTVYRP